MRKTVFLALLTSWLICSPSLMAEVYKVVDPVTGKVTFTDTPPADREQGQKLDVRITNTQAPLDIPKKTQPEERADAATYDSLNILQPTPESTVPPGQIDLVVQVQASPMLKENHLIRILYDGKPRTRPASSTSFVLTDLYRGTHQIRAQIVDDEGNVLKESSPVTFYVKRASRLINPGAN